MLRHQRPGRPRLFKIDRLLRVWLYRLWPHCLDAMVLVTPATVVQWHRQGFRLFWRWRSRSGRPSVDREIRNLIRQMNAVNPLWGAPRIHGEMPKLGIEISQAGDGDHRSHHCTTLTLAALYVERVIGSIRGECLDHIVIFNERHLRRVRDTSGTQPEQTITASAMSFVG